MFGEYPYDSSLVVNLRYVSVTDMVIILQKTPQAAKHCGV
ncbi:hypothetical protein HMPREF3232_00977 [Fannyhessea vaginae]|nr:hypothetical protein HMPREF3232_00977 [Fannyhessea vaginae]